MGQLASILAALLLVPAARSVTLTDLEGRLHSPLKVNGAPAHVLLFLTTDCPIANSFAPEIAALLKDYAATPVRFYLVHTDPDLTAEAARTHAREFGLTGTLLLDRKHQLVQATGVTMVPEAAVLLPDGTIAYRGRINDLYAEIGKKRPAATQHDLRAALSAVLAGKPVANPRTAAVGCDLPAPRR